MKHIFGIVLTIAIMVAIGGCLATGQITLFEPIDFGATTSTEFNAYVVDLNENDDYADNKDKIKSVDGVGIVAVIANQLSSPARATFYISDDATLKTVEDVMDPDNATLVFISPEIPGNTKTTIEWAEGFDYIMNEEAIIDQVLGDGVFALYAIAETPPFNLHIKGVVSVTLTVGK